MLVCDSELTLSCESLNTPSLSSSSRLCMRVFLHSRILCDKVLSQCLCESDHTGFVSVLPSLRACVCSQSCDGCRIFLATSTTTTSLWTKMKMTLGTKIRQDLPDSTATQSMTRTKMTFSTKIALRMHTVNLATEIIQWMLTEMTLVAKICDYCTQSKTSLFSCVQHRKF